MHGADVELAFQRLKDGRTFLLKPICSQSGVDDRGFRVVRSFSTPELAYLHSCFQIGDQTYLRFACSSNWLMTFAEVGMFELEEKIAYPARLLDFLKGLAEEQREIEYQRMEANNENSWS